MLQAFKSVFFVTFLGLLFSCSGNKEKNTPSTEVGKNLLKWATNLKILEKKDYYLVTIYGVSDKKQQWALVKNLDVSSPTGYKKIPIPIKSMASSSGEYSRSVEELGFLSKLKAIGNANYHFSPKIKEATQKGEIIELNKGSFDAEKLLALNPDLYMEMGTQQHSADLEKLERIYPNIIYNYSYLEQHPLGRAEWIKLYGLLFGDFKKAEDYFKKVEISYLNLVQQQKESATQKSILLNAPYSGKWYLPNQHSYMSTMVKDAGFTYKLSKNNKKGIETLEPEQVFDLFKDADVWINPSVYKTLEEISNSDDRLALFKAFKEGNVYSNMIKNPNGSTDYWELGILQPNLVLEDLVHINQNSLDTKANFFGKLPK
jgi:iron complex transport system substrate-binding protein